MAFALLILAMALVTFATRYSMFVIMGRWSTLPRVVTLALEFVPIAAFSAVIAPELLLRSEASGIVPSGMANPRLIAGVAAILVARRMLLTIVVGMAVLWIAQGV